MATTHEIPAESRSVEGKGASRRLRHSGKVPAIVYGSNEPPANIQLDHNTVWLASHNEWFYSAILDLALDGKKQKVLLRDLQRHPFKPQLLHLDFQRVDENKAIRIRVPLHFLNQEKSPAGKMAGVLISHALTDIEISCLPKDLPEYLEGRSWRAERRRHRAYFRPEAAQWRRDSGIAPGQGARRCRGHRAGAQAGSRSRSDGRSRGCRWRTWCSGRRWWRSCTRCSCRTGEEGREEVTASMKYRCCA
jgi:large subunit ribosomal protein L25